MSDEHDTPAELPPHPDTGPMVKALLDLASQVGGVAARLANLAHEMRVARAPAAGGIIGRLKDAFETLKGIGDAGVEAFK